VLDVDMPFVDGFTVLRQIRRSRVHADAPVLMLAARHSEADRERATMLGANGYLAKPLQLRPLNAMVESMML
jgi:DNA-binding response OmpR family regulator